MNDEARTRILERVRKMLRLANDAGASEGERNNAMRMAHATLAKYNLDLAAAEESGKPTEEPRIHHIHAFGGWPWARNIAHSVAKLFFCDYLYIRGRTDRTLQHYFIGRTSNATTAAIVAEFVVTSVIKEASKLARDGHLGNAFVRSFGWGAASRIHERVEALKRDAQQTFDPAEQSRTTDGRALPSAASRALVLASYYQLEHDANKRYVEKQFGETKKGRSGKVADSDAGYHAGRVHGDRVSLNAQVGSPSNTQRIGRNS